MSGPGVELARQVATDAEEQIERRTARAAVRKCRSPDRHCRARLIVSFYLKQRSFVVNIAVQKLEVFGTTVLY
ncbi:MAG TPA: hypothetical protein VMF64_10410 [Steroidobacteraceae bacterium]|nr:hypothetical protein [Steroidobacteraceae bacterium]